MWEASVQKTFIDEIGEEILYTFTVTADTEDEAINLACIYASMVEYGMDADKWSPKEMAFPREQLYQFIQPQALEQMESIYADVVPTAYSNAMAYVQSYVGNMFDIDAMLVSGDTSSTALTLRLALCICTVTFILGSAPQYSEVLEMHNQQLHTLLKGLKSGQRNFGKGGIVAEPNVRVSVVSLKRTGARP